MSEYKRGNPTAGLGSIFGGIIALIFAAIIIFVMVAIIEITGHDSGTAAIVFTSINMFVIIFTMFLSGEIAKKTTTVCVTQIWMVTILYTIIEVVYMMTQVSTAEPKWFILINLVLLFFYIGILAPVILSGIRQKHYRNEQDKVIKE